MKEHKTWTWTISILTVIVVVLCLRAVYLLFCGDNPTPVRYALMAGMVGFGATAVGSLPGFYLKNISERGEDVLLGSAAGMMLAAAIFSLLLPAVSASEGVFGGNEWLAMAWVVFGMALGVLMLLGINVITPHEHFATGAEGPEVPGIKGSWLFVMAIIIHNFPEGLAMGISFAKENLDIGIPLTVAIGLQDLPEGLAIVLALRATGISSMKAVLIGVASGIMEPLGALLGVSVVTGMDYAYPLGLALSAGAMIFVVSHEVIPETHRNGHQTAATIGLMVGFALMMILEKAFG